MTESKPAGVILAGGRSSRMGGQQKALVGIAGRPLLAHVIERLRPQVDGLLLSCQPAALELEDFGLEQVPDLVPGYRGPLAGLYSAMRHLADAGRQRGLVLCPCDAPFVPHNLVQRLLEASAGDKPVAPAWGGVLQPTFSFWPLHVMEAVHDMLVVQGLGGPRQALQRLPHRVIEWEQVTPPPFFNVNTPEDLAAARDWLDRSGE